MDRYVFNLGGMVTRQTHTSCRHRSEAIGSYFLCARNWLHFTSPVPKTSTFVIPDLLSLIVARDINADKRQGLANMSLIRYFYTRIQRLHMMSRTYREMIN